MANKYWIGNEPDSDVSSAEAQDLAQLGKDASVGAIDAGGAAAINGAAAKVLEVSLNGVTYFIPLHTVNE
jgi:hypothetical protein